MKYPYIAAWGRMQGSNSDYVAAEMLCASRAKAPKDACYFSVDEQRWVPFSEIRREDTKATVLRLLPKAA